MLSTLGYNPRMTLKDYREAAKLSVSEVARRMGVSHTAVMKMEKANNPRLSSIRRYAEAVGVPADELLKNVTLGLITA